MNVRVVGLGHMGTLHKGKLEDLEHTVHTVDPVVEDADFPNQDDCPTADFVVISTPADQIVQEAKVAIEQGVKKLLVEKPIATSVKEAESLMTAAYEAKAVVGVNFTERANPAVLNTYVLMFGLGHASSFTAERLCPDPERETAGPILDLSIHDIDLLRAFGLDIIVGSVTETADKAEIKGTSRDETAVTIRSDYLTDPSSRTILIEGKETIEIDLVNRSVLRNGEELEIEDVDPLEQILTEASQGNPHCLLWDGVESLKLALAAKEIASAD